MRKVLDLTEGTVSVAVQMSEGNPGAASVLGKLMETPGAIALYFMALEDMNIRGSQIWVGYKDFCNHDIEAFKDAILRRDQHMIDAINVECLHSGEEAVTHGTLSAR